MMMMAQQYATRQRTARPTLHTSRSEGLQERRGYTRQEISVYRVCFHLSYSSRKRRRRRKRVKKPKKPIENKPDHFKQVFNKFWRIVLIRTMIPELLGQKFRFWLQLSRLLRRQELRVYWRWRCRENTTQPAKRQENKWKWRGGWV